MTIASLTRILVLCGAALALSPVVQASAPPSFDMLDRDYDKSIRPILQQYCLTCHSTEKRKGDLDLQAYAKVSDFRQHPEVWQQMAEVLDRDEMPPKKNPKPTAEQRAQLRRWVAQGLDAEGAASPGDPGPVVMRRLTNVEYNNTVRDLTGIDLEPAREFPADGAAGEGFTNVSDALVISPETLDKYMAAAKNIAAHAVLLPDGVRFSEKSTRPDWTEEILTEIRQLYRQYTDPSASTKVQLQGLTWDSKGGGRIPLESYLAATLAYRERTKPEQTLEQIAAERNLSAKYLKTLWNTLNEPDHSPLTDWVRQNWRVMRAADVANLAKQIRQWQDALTTFGSVGHFKPWQKPANPIEESRTFRIKLEPTPHGAISLTLAARDAGDGSAGDIVEWQQPRLEAPGRPPILLRDLRGAFQVLQAKRKTVYQASRYLAAADAVRQGQSKADAATLAKEHQLDPDMMAAWLAYLGIADDGPPATLENLFTERLETGGGYAFIKSWGSPATPSVTANASDQEVRIPGIMKPHSVAVHPSPTRNVAVAWKSPIKGRARIEAKVVHAHPECGDGLSWSLELRRGSERRRLAGGNVDRGQAAKIEPIASLGLHPGDLVCLVIGPRGDHSCDLTQVDLTIIELEGNRRWGLAHDVSGNLLAGNPHADSVGNPGVWSFFHEARKGETSPALASIPVGSILDRWRDEPDPGTRAKLADQVERLLRPVMGDGGVDPDGVLRRQLTSLQGPLLGRLDAGKLARLADPHGLDITPPRAPNEPVEPLYGLDPGMFGKHPLRHKTDDSSLVVQAPWLGEFVLPRELVEGREFVVTASLDRQDGTEGSVQVQVSDQ